MDLENMTYKELREEILDRVSKSYPVHYGDNRLALADGLLTAFKHRVIIDTLHRSAGTHRENTVAVLRAALKACNVTVPEEPS